MNKNLRSLVLATQILALGTGVAFAQVNVVGNSRIDKATIQSYFTGTDDASVQNATQALRNSGMFRDVRVSRAGGRVTVAVTENAILNRVVVEGNRRVKSETIVPELQSKARGPYSQDLIRADVERIVEIYRRSGRHDVNVTPKTIDAPNGRYDLVFEVSEGAKQGIKKIAFVGNQNFSDRRLKDEMGSAETGILSWIKNNDVYDPDRISADQEALRRFYVRHGYADFRVVSAVADLDKQNGGFFVTITVDEGPQYRFGQIDVASNFNNLDAGQMRGLVRANTGSIYNVELVDKTIDRLSVEASKRGYAFAQVRPRGNKNTANRTIDVTFIVEEGPRVYVERIDIRGNTRTRDYVIRREFDLAEGDAYNRVLVDRAERRLNNLTYFKNVKITSEPGSAPDRIIINVEVEDQPTGNLSFGVGVSSTEGIVGDVSVSEKNWMGRGQYLKLGTTFGKSSRGVDFSFTEPFFLDRRLSAGFDLFWRETKRNNHSFYDSKMAGGAIRFGIPISEELTLQTRYSAYQQRITLDALYKDCTPALLAACIANGEASVSIRELDGLTRNVSMLGYSLVYNTLDRNNEPRSGALVEFKQDLAGLGGNARFLKTEFDARYFHPLIGDLVGSLRLQAGNVMSAGGGKLKVLDQFVRGPELVRGFAPSGIGPRDFTFESANTRSDAIGGTNYWGGSAEVTFPIFGLAKELGLRGAVFADAGSVWGYNATTSFAGIDVDRIATNGEDSTGHKLRSSVGLGLLWSSPFGPIRFDYSWVISKAPWDKTQPFRFSGGTRF